MLQILSALTSAEPSVALLLLMAFAWAFAIAAIGVMDHQIRRQTGSLANCHPAFNPPPDTRTARRRGWW